MNYEQIGKFIQKKRKEKNLTQKELAQKLNITDKAISKWERGLGCPDVSILELLANELDVSILEILKGRIIENEIIKVTEANDYIEETIKYTKQNKIETTNKIITFLIISITLLLLILNIENITRMNKKYEYDFNNETVKEIKHQLNKLKNNIEIIENNQGKFKNDEYEQIKKELKNIKGKINNSKLLQYENKTELTLKDIYIIDDNILVDIYGIRILKELEKYNTNNEELFKDNVMAKIYLNINIHEQIEKAYKYKIIDIPNNLEIPVTTFTNPINLRVMYMKSTISSYLYITEKIIEVGEINE